MTDPIRFVVFDLDGTLVDSRRDIAESANAVIEEAGGQALPELTVARMVGDGAALLIRRALEAAGLPVPPDALARFLRVYDSRLLLHTRAYDGIDAMLTAVASRAPLAILTNKPIDATRLILDGLGLSRHVPPDRVFGGDGPHPRKPDPAGLVALARAAGVDPGATLLVGDSLIDWKTARAAGSRICMARYGFGYVDFPTDRLAPGDLGIDAPRELPTLL